MFFDKLYVLPRVLKERTVMALPPNHFAADGSCSCTFDGKCCECGKPCNDHDLVADWWWCGECINRHLDEDEAKRKEQNDAGH